MMSQDDISYISTRSDSSGKLEMNGSLNLGNGFSFKTEGFFMDNDMQKSHLAFEFMKEFNDSHLSYKFGGGSHSFSMMQSFNSKLMGGFEMYYIVRITVLITICSLIPRMCISVTVPTIITTFIPSSHNIYP